MMDWKKIRKIGGWLTINEGRALYKEAKVVKEGGKIVEIGSWKGRSTVCLAQGAKDGSRSKVWAIDPHVGSMGYLRLLGSKDTFGEFKKNIKELEAEKLVEILRFRSWEVAGDFKEEIDFLLIDGDHSLWGVGRDWRDWWPKLKEGGTTAFHDSWHRWEIQGLTGIILLFSKMVKKPKLVDTLTIFEKCERNNWKERLENAFFVIKRFLVGWKGTLDLFAKGMWWN
jgi:hypothetical protein